jgi:hypothetical protein
MQLHLYVPDDVGEAVRKRAEFLGLTTSRYLADLVMRDVGGGWPAGFFNEVIGGWVGAPLEREEQGSPEERDSFDE